MTDRVQALLVVLDDDYREDDLQDLQRAIAQFRYVADVTEVPVDIPDYLARSRVQNALLDDIMALFTGRPE